VTYDDALRGRLLHALATHDRLAVEAPGLRRAAVVVGLLPEGSGAQLAGIAAPAGWSEAAAVLLTRRAAGLRRHGGQWALPGGSIDAGESAVQAALRELHEEVGLALGTEAVLGLLDDYATRSGWVITPVVAWLGEARSLVPDPSEVASLHRIPAREFLRADAPLLDPGDDPARPVLRMPVGQGWIAAPTGAVLYQFRELLVGRTTRVGHYDQPEFARR
jgi:8-oxo-dGTP pyrophosphatase MutT (NUDIX family)